MASSDGDNKYVQYGCGLSAPSGWVNFDSSPTLRAQRLLVLGTILGPRLGPVFPAAVRYGDILLGLPLPDQSVNGIYCSHVLEHLSLEDCRLALKNTFRVLRPGGRFRLVMPDLKLCAQSYLSSNDPGAALAFMRSTLLGQERRPRGVMGAIRGWIGNAEHRWLWDFPSVEQELKQAGFVGVRPARFNDSEDRVFSTVEDQSRWVDALGVECMRPEGAARS